MFSCNTPAGDIQNQLILVNTSKEIRALTLTGGSDSYFYSECTTNRTTTSTTCVKAHGLSATTLAGRYNIEFIAQYGNATASQCTRALFKIDNVAVGTCLQI
jgi:hypothetical protein